MTKRRFHTCRESGTSRENPRRGECDRGGNSSHDQSDPPTNSHDLHAAIVQTSQEIAGARNPPCTRRDVLGVATACLLTVCSVSATTAARADEVKPSDSDRRVTLTRGELELSLDTYASNAWDDRPRRELTNWIAMRPSAIYGVSDRWEVGAEAFLAAKRAYAEIDLVATPSLPETGRRPLERFGAVFLDATYALVKHVGVRLRLGRAQFGGHALGPYAEPKFPNRDRPADPEGSGWRTAWGLSVPFRIGVANGATVLAAAGVDSNAEAEFGGDLYVALNSVYLEAWFQYCVRERMCLSMGADLRRTENPLDVTLAGKAVGRIGDHFELGVYAATREMIDKLYSNSERATIVGLTLMTRFHVH